MNEKRNDFKLQIIFQYTEAYLDNRTSQFSF